MVDMNSLTYHYSDIIMSTIASQVQAEIEENAKTPRHWPLRGEFTGDRCIDCTKGQQHWKCLHLMTSSCFTASTLPRVSSAHGDAMTWKRLSHYFCCVREATSLHHGIPLQRSVMHEFWCFHLMWVWTSCWINSPFSGLPVTWDAVAYLLRHCIEITVWFGKDFLKFQVRPKFKSMVL